MSGSSQREWPFTRKNWTILVAGLATIVIGYLLLRIPPADGFASLTLAPILLVLGYCVLIPAALLIEDRPGESPSASPADEA